jgi:hypothetical protein
LLATDGQKLVWESDNLGTEAYAYVKLENIEFPAGQWFDTCPYTITFQTDYIYGLVDDDLFPTPIQSASENWSFQPDAAIDQLSATHTVSAVGKTIYLDGVIPTGAYQYAKSYVLSRIGYDAVIVSGALIREGIELANLNPYNYARQETIDELGGSYSLTETWTLYNRPYTDIYVTTINYLPEDAERTISASVRGTVQGLWTGINNRELAYINAQSGWLDVHPQLTGRVPGASNFINGTVDNDPTNGSIQYNFEYDNKPIVSGAIHTFTVNRTWAQEDYKSTVSIDGQVQGRITTGELASVKFDRAYAQWIGVERDLYNVAVRYSSGGVTNLRRNPVSRNVTENPIAGAIQYQFTYNNREYELYDDTYTVTLNYGREDGINRVGVNGTVVGYDNYSGTLLDRYNNALSGLPTETQIYGRARDFSRVYINPTIVSKEIARSPGGGSVSYNYQYSSEATLTSCYTGFVSLNLSVVDIHPGQIVVEQPVIARAQGPVLQDMQTFTSRKRQITVDGVAILPTGVCNITTLYAAKPDVWPILSGLRPTATQTYLTEDSNDSYDVLKGRFSRSITYTYENP